MPYLSWARGWCRGLRSADLRRGVKGVVTMCALLPSPRLKRQWRVHPGTADRPIGLLFGLSGHVRRRQAMNVAVLKGLLALAATSALFAGSAIRYHRRGTVGSALQLVGVACFVVVALAHVCEAPALLPALGWGQPRSLGHYIDLGAAVLGI